MSASPARAVRTKLFPDPVSPSTTVSSPVGKVADTSLSVNEFSFSSLDHLIWTSCNEISLASTLCQGVISGSAKNSSKRSALVQPSVRYVKYRGRTEISDCSCKNNSMQV